MRREILYRKIAKIIEDQILSETLRIGDKLPSIRSIQQIYGVSLNTAIQAFAELESKSLIESRPKSGYFVSKTSQRKLALPSVSKLISPEKGKNSEDLISSVFDILRDKSIRQFSLGIPDNKLLPMARLNKGIIKAMRQLEGSGMDFEPAQGSVSLRRNIAKWSLIFDGTLTEDDIVTTTGTTNAIYQCLLATTKPGDTIATESPVYFGILQLAKSMGLHVIELPTHPLTGIEIDALKKVIHKINVCCFTANFNNPLGSLVPDENKKEVVRLLTHHNIPLIDRLPRHRHILRRPSRLLSPPPCVFLSMIRKLKSGEYRLYSRKKDPKTGKRRNLGTFGTRAAAEKHEREVQYFKRH